MNWCCSCLNRWNKLNKSPEPIETSQEQLCNLNTKVKWDRRIGTFWIINSLRKTAQHSQITPGDMQTFMTELDEMKANLIREDGAGSLTWKTCMAKRKQQQWTMYMQIYPYAAIPFASGFGVFFLYLNTEPPRLFVALGINDQHQLWQ